MKAGALALGILACGAIPAPAATVEEQKPMRTVIGGTPWVARPAPVGPKVIYGTDDRIDLYQETDAARRTWAASTCGLFTASSVQANNDGTFTLRTSAYDVCEEEPFSNQPTAAFCTGFMVGEDIIATAGHCYDDGDLSGVRFVFGFVMDDANTPVVTVAGEQVYQGIELLGRALAGDEDYAIIRVDRRIEAPGAEAFPIRREGTISVGAPIGVIGHPSGLPLKLAFGNNTAVRSNDSAGYFVANLDTYGGNSGSPVIDPLTGTLEGILVRGETDFVSSGNCSVSNVVSNTGGRGEDVSKSTSFMQFIPESISTNGALALDQARYGCDATVMVSLSDSDLAGQASVTIQVDSAGGDSEPLSLTSLSAEGEFSGSISIQASTVAAGNGTIEAAEGDLLTFRYADATHGPTAPDVVEAEALVDCTGPLVTNVTITQVGAQFATVSFETNEEARGTVRAGAACANYDEQAIFAANTTHLVLLEGLLPLNEYYAAIEAVDGAGNSTVADNEGACFRFVTAETTEYFTQVFATGVPDLAKSTTLFTPREDGDGYTICHDAITELPIPGTGATTVVLSDDGFEEVALSGGAKFPFYGAQYERVFVNANGNVTFDSGDTAFEPSAQVHLSVPRISPCFTDLNPTGSGSVWFLQMSDRLVVTWQNVPHYNYGGANSIQLELHFDGAIRFSFDGLTGTPALSGLSAGQGARSDFVSTDLSAEASCGTGGERYHSADSDRNHAISMQETLRVIQFMNLSGYHCDDSGQDGYAAGAGSETCTPHDIDYNPQDWSVNMSELLRVVQFYNAGSYRYDADSGTEDGFVPVVVP